MIRLSYLWFRNIIIPSSFVSMTCVRNGSSGDMTSLSLRESQTIRKGNFLRDMGGSQPGRNHIGA